MAAQNVLRQITVILYKLKRQYGLRVTYFQFTSQTNNIETGDISRTYTQFIIKRAPVLPDNLDRSFVYDLTYIAANNNFVGGALFDRHLRKVIIDAKDLPKDFIPNLNDHVQFDDVRYEIKRITHLEKRKGYLLSVEAIDSSEPVG